MSEVTDLLIQAGLLISKPETWSQGAIARRRNGGAALANPSASSANCWCIIGAVYAAAGANPLRLDKLPQETQKTVLSALAALSATASRIHKKTVEAVNDSADHETALELIRATIRHERRGSPSLQS